MPHPYTEFEGSATWDILDAALTALEINRDLSLTTARSYVIGYLCSSLATHTPDEGESMTTSGKKAAATRRRRAAAKKAATTRRRSAAAKKAAVTRRRKSAARKAAATRAKKRLS